MFFNHITLGLFEKKLPMKFRNLCCPDKCKSTGVDLNQNKNKLVDLPEPSSSDREVYDHVERLSKNYVLVGVVF